MPLWVGETGGLFPSNRRTQGIDLLRQCLSKFEEHRISWSLWAYKDARAMSLVFPNRGTPWMKFVGSLRAKWQSKKTHAANVTDEVFSLLQDRFAYDLDDKTREECSFRISSLLYDLHVKYLLEPKLRSMPWHETMELPKSFLWENCRRWQELEALVRELTGKK